MRVEDLQKKLDARFGSSLTVRREDRSIIVSGEMDSWHDIVTACSMCTSREPGVHVVNDIRLRGAVIPAMRMPHLQDRAIEGKHPDVLIIGGGISGCSIARELMRWHLRVLVIDKEADVAIQASGRNDGEVHPGVDLSKGSLKQKYVVRGNRMYDRICRQLDVPFARCGQYVGFFDPKLRPLVEAYAWQRKHICGVDDTRVISRDELQQGEQHLNPDFAFALFNPMAGVVSPYQLTIAYAENAIANGAEFSLNTVATSMKVNDGRIESVTTNRGIVYPKLVINAAGVFADDVAAMAGDRFYSIHPRRGTDLILDRKAGALVRSVASWKDLKKTNSHSKGGGIIHTPSSNLLIGPDAVETYEKENYATSRASVEAIMSKQKRTAPDLDGRDIITYFTGVRAADFEEDFIIEPGRKTHNLIHVAGIQSPGLTTAPAVAEDVAAMAVEELQKSGVCIERNAQFNPIRKGIPRLKDMDLSARNDLILKNPDYGVIVCRCEEISKGEIIDAIHNPLGVATLDSIKRRVRPGMGRCQGGFCSPLVVQLIAQETGIPMEKVQKSGEGSWINWCETKEADE